MGPAHLEFGSAMIANWSTSIDSFTADYSTVGSDDICLLEDLPYAHIFIPTMNFITFFTGFFGNLYVILLMARKQGSKRLVDTFVLNLAVADLVFVCTLPFWAVSVALGYWCFGEVICKLSSYTISVNRCSSILFLMGMSVERFLVIMKHWDSRSMGTKKTISMSCGCIWMISLLVGIPSLVYRKLIPMKYTSKSLCQDETPSTTFSLVLLILTFLLPLGVILFCYCSIFSKLRGHVSQGKRRNNALKIIFAIIGAFICFWLPFNTFSAFLIFAVSQNMYLSCPEQTALRWGLTTSACLAFTNSCINPIIYVFMDQHFRQQALKYCTSFCNKGGTMQNSALAFSSTESSLLFANKKKFTSVTSNRLEDVKGTGTDVQTSARCLILV
ncbi:probable G-protein coupled receptor 25 [Eublepharis macularius]|uniref:Probable G-protein coupled receptor 25 n=1 Tax=Eublepharis macularius TaxID=481883 RepID=A0AA97JFM4_EUBMA|nr:probable G-protein coupled receptor 25 [Eublepharis macularius]